MSEQGTAKDCNELDTILKTLTMDQLRYVAERPYCATDIEACKKIGKSQSTVSRWKNKADVDLAVKLMALDGVIVSSELFRRNLAKASNVIIKQLEHKNASIAFRAAVEVKDTAMGKPTQRQEITGKDGSALAIHYVNDWRDLEKDGD